MGLVVALAASSCVDPPPPPDWTDTSLIPVGETLMLTTGELNSSGALAYETWQGNGPVSEYTSDAVYVDLAAHPLGTEFTDLLAVTDPNSDRRVEAVSGTDDIVVNEGPEDSPTELYRETLPVDLLLRAHRTRFSPDGSKVMIYRGSSLAACGEAAIVDLNSGTLLSKAPHCDPSGVITWSRIGLHWAYSQPRWNPQGTAVYWPTIDGVRFEDPITTSIATLAAAPGAEVQIAVTPDRCVVKDWSESGRLAFVCAGVGAGATAPMSVMTTDLNLANQRTFATGTATGAVFVDGGGTLVASDLQYSPYSGQGPALEEYARVLRFDEAAGGANTGVISRQPHFLALMFSSP